MVKRFKRFKTMRCQYVDAVGRFSSRVGFMGCCFCCFCSLFFFWFRLSVLVLVPICRWCRSVMFLFVDGEGAIIVTCRPQSQDVTYGGVDILSQFLHTGWERPVCLLYWVCYSVRYSLNTNLSIVFCLDSVKFLVWIFKFLFKLRRIVMFLLLMVKNLYDSIC